MSLSDGDPWSDEEKVREAEEDLRRAGLETWATLPDLGMPRAGLTRSPAARGGGGGVGSQEGSGKGRAAPPCGGGGGRLQLRHGNPAAARASRSPSRRAIRVENVPLPNLEGQDEVAPVLDRTPGSRRLRLPSTTALPPPLRRAHVVQSEPVTLASNGCSLQSGTVSVEGLLDVPLMGHGSDPKDGLLDDVHYKIDMGFEGLFCERRSDWVMENLDLAASTAREVARQTKMRQGGARALAFYAPRSDALYFCGAEGRIVPSLRGESADEALQVARSRVDAVVEFHNLEMMPTDGRKRGCNVSMIPAAPGPLRALETDDTAIDLDRPRLEKEVSNGKRLFAVPEVSTDLIKPMAPGAADAASVGKGACVAQGDAGGMEVEEIEWGEAYSVGLGEPGGRAVAHEWNAMRSRVTFVDVSAGAPMGPFHTLHIGDDISEIELAVSGQMQRPSASAPHVKIGPLVQHPDTATDPDALPPLQHSKTQMPVPPVELSAIEGTAVGELVAQVQVAAAPRSLATLSAQTWVKGAPGMMLAAGRERPRPTGATVEAADNTDPSPVAIRTLEDRRWEMFDVMEVKESSATSVSRYFGSMHGGESESGQADRQEEEVAVDRMQDVDGKGDSEDLHSLSPPIGGRAASDTAAELSEGSQVAFAATAAVSATVEDDLESFMKLRGIDASAPARSSVSAAAASLTEIAENEDRSVTKIRVEIAQDSALSKQIYDIKCLTASIVQKLEVQQVVNGRETLRPDYILAIADNIRSQIEKSNCTIASTQLVMTWSALMATYVLTKLGDQLVRQGPMAALAFLASACEDVKWDAVLNAVLGSAKKELTDGLEELCKDAEHPYWPALRTKVSSAIVTHEGLKPAVLVKSSLMFESVSRALYGNSYRVRYFKTGSASELVETLRGDEACVVVLTEQALLECDPSHYNAVSILYHFQPPGPGVTLLVGCFKKVTRIEIVEPRIDPMLIETGARGFRDTVQVDVKTEDLWVDSGEELCGGALLHRSVNIKLFANNDVMQMRNVLLMLEQENVATIERPLMKADLSLGNMCILVRDVEELCSSPQEDNGSAFDMLLLLILELSVAFSHIVLLLQQSVDEHDCITGPSLTSDEWVKLHGIFDSYGVECHVREIFSNRQLAVEIRASVELCCGLEAERRTDRATGPSGPLKNGARELNELCSRQELVAFTQKHAPIAEEETELEALLASFPSLSYSSVHAVIKCIEPHGLSVQDLIQGSIDDDDLINLLATVLPPDILQGFRTTCLAVCQQPIRASSPTPSPQRQNHAEPSSLPNPSSYEVDQFFDAQQPSLSPSAQQFRPGPWERRGGTDGIPGMAFSPDQYLSQEAEEAGGGWVVQEYNPQHASGGMGRGIARHGGGMGGYRHRQQRQISPPVYNDREHWEELESLQPERRRTLKIVRNGASTQTRLAWSASQPPEAPSYLSNSYSEAQPVSGRRPSKVPRFSFDCPTPVFDEEELEDEAGVYDRYPTGDFASAEQHTHNQNRPRPNVHAYGEGTPPHALGGYRPGDYDGEGRGGGRGRNSDYVLNGVARGLEEYVAREAQNSAMQLYDDQQESRPFRQLNHPQSQQGGGWASRSQPERIFQRVQKHPTSHDRRARY